MEINVGYVLFFNWHLDQLRSSGDVNELVTVKILGLNAASLYDIGVPAELKLPTPRQDTVDAAAGAKEAVPL